MQVDDTARGIGCNICKSCGAEVKISVCQLKVRMRPKPWSKRWERPTFNIQGIHFDLALSPEQMEHAQKWAKPWQEYDMLKEYDTSKLQEQIYTEVQQEMSK